MAGGGIITQCNRLLFDKFATISRLVLLCVLAVLSSSALVFCVCWVGPCRRSCLGLAFPTASEQCNRVRAAQPVPALSILMLIEWVGRRRGAGDE